MNSQSLVAKDYAESLLPSLNTCLCMLMGFCYYYLIVFIYWYVFPLLLVKRAWGKVERGGNLFNLMVMNISSHLIFFLFSSHMLYVGSRWSLLEKYSCKASKLHLKPRRFKIFVEALVSLTLSHSHFDDKIYRHDFTGISLLLFHEGEPTLERPQKEYKETAISWRK